MIYNFDDHEANDYGVFEAIVIYNLRFWIIKNKANNKHQFRGEDEIIRTWTYNSQEAFQKIFWFWTKDQVRRILERLLEKEVIVKGNFNDNSYNKTAWYAFKDEGKFLSQERLFAHLANLPDREGKNAMSTWQNNQIEMANSQNRNGEIAKSNNNDTDIKPYKKPDKKKEENQVILFFETFWDKWVAPKGSHKGGRPPAEKAFNKVISDKENPVDPVELIYAAMDYLKSCKDEEIKVCHVTTWLNGGRYIEFIDAANARKVEDEKYNQSKQIEEEKYKDLSGDPFWIKAKEDLLKAPELAKWRGYIEQFTYCGTDDNNHHIIIAPSKFIRDWFKREYKPLLDKIFGKWVLVTKS